MRNPSQNKEQEWQGDWSDQSKLWTPKLKKQLNFTDDDSDGIFWMCFEDFKKQYVNVHICKYIDSYQYCSFKKLDDMERKFSVFKVEVS